MTEIAASFVAEWRVSGDDATRKKVAWSTLTERLQASDLEVDILEDALLQVESLQEWFSNTCVLEYITILEWAATKHPRCSFPFFLSKFAYRHLPFVLKLITHSCASGSFFVLCL
jgi:hypothetical protein